MNAADKASLLAALRAGNPGSALADELERLPLGEVAAYLQDFARRHQAALPSPQQQLAATAAAEQ